MEAKHSYFKEIPRQGNFKNVALSVSRRHQKLMCTLVNNDNFFNRSFVTSTGMLLQVGSIYVIYI